MKDLFPTLDASLAVSREYLCAKDEKTELLVRFEDELAKLRIPPEEIRAGVREHVEWMQNSGRITVEGMAKLRATLEPHALSHFSRSLDLLEGRFSHTGTETDLHADRLKKLRDSVRYARAKGA